MSDRKSNFPQQLGVAALIGVAAAGVGYFLGKAAQPTFQENATHFNRTARECSECCVCLDEMEVTVFPCGHTMHTKCAKGMKESDRKNKKVRSECPLCRRPFDWDDTHQKRS